MVVIVLLRTRIDECDAPKTAGYALKFVFRKRALIIVMIPYSSLSDMVNPPFKLFKIKLLPHFRQIKRCKRSCIQLIIREKFVGAGVHVMKISFCTREDIIEHITLYVVIVVGIRIFRN